MTGYTVSGVGSAYTKRLEINIIYRENAVVRSSVSIEVIQ